MGHSNLNDAFRPVPGSDNTMGAPKCPPIAYTVNYFDQRPYGSALYRVTFGTQIMVVTYTTEEGPIHFMK